MKKAFSPRLGRLRSRDAELTYLARLLLKKEWILGRVRRTRTAPDL